MMARSIGGSRRRRCVCGLACLAAPPSAAGSAAPSPTHTPPAVTQENLQSTTLDIGVFWVGLLAPARSWSGRRCQAGESQRAMASWLSGSQRDPAQLGCASRPRPARGATRARPRHHTSPPARLTAPCAPTLSGGDMGVARGGGVLAAPVRVAAPRGHCPRAERRQHRRLRAMQIRRACPRAHLPCRRAALRPPPFRSAALPPPRRPDIHSYACRPRCVPQMRGRRSPVR